MPTYVIVTKIPNQVPPRLRELFPDTYPIAVNAWIVRSEAGTREISEALFPQDEDRGAVEHVVVRFDAYWGNHDQPLWEWISKTS